MHTISEFTPDMIESQKKMFAKVDEFIQKCMARDPGVSAELLTTGFGDYVLHTENSEGAVVQYAINVSVDGDINIARILP